MVACAFACSVRSVIEKGWLTVKIVLKRRLASLVGMETAAVRDANIQNPHILYDTMGIVLRKA